MVSEVESMTTSQKIGIIIVLISSIYSLVSIARYWLADVQYASGQKNYQFFTKTQEPKYLLSSYEHLSAALQLNRTEPVISSEFSVTAAYLSAAFGAKDATASSQLAQLASGYAQKAISQSPHHPNYYKSAARVYILLSDLPSAAEVLTQAAQISPTDPRLPYNLGLIYESMGKNDLARQSYQRSLDLKPDFPDAKKALSDLTGAK